jgi:hypothetical protein
MSIRLSPSLACLPSSLLPSTPCFLELTVCILGAEPRKRVISKEGGLTGQHLPIISGAILGNSKEGPPYHTTALGFFFPLSCTSTYSHVLRSTVHKDGNEENPRESALPQPRTSPAFGGENALASLCPMPSTSKCILGGEFLV